MGLQLNEAECSVRYQEDFIVQMKSEPIHEGRIGKCQGTIVTGREHE